MAVKVPEGWQLLKDFCRAHKIPYMRAYRRLVLEAKGTYRTLGTTGRKRIIVPIAMATKGLESNLDGRKRRRIPPPIEPALYTCGHPECIYAKCRHKRA